MRWRPFAGSVPLARWLADACAGGPATCCRMAGACVSPMIVDRELMAIALKHECSRRSTGGPPQHCEKPLCQLLGRRGDLEPQRDEARALMSGGTDGGDKSRPEEARMSDPRLMFQSTGRTTLVKGEAPRCDANEAGQAPPARRRARAPAATGAVARRRRAHVWSVTCVVSLQNFRYVSRCVSVTSPVCF